MTRGPKMKTRVPRSGSRSMTPAMRKVSSPMSSLSPILSFRRRSTSSSTRAPPMTVLVRERGRHRTGGRRVDRAVERIEIVDRLELDQKPRVVVAGSRHRRSPWRASRRCPRRCPRHRAPSYTSADTGRCTRRTSTSPPRILRASSRRPVCTADDSEPTAAMAATPSARHAVKMRKPRRPPRSSRRARRQGRISDGAHRPALPLARLGAAAARGRHRRCGRRRRARCGRSVRRARRHG